MHPDWIASVNAALDEVERTDGVRALATAATGKFFSNGLDLEWLMAHGDQHHEYVVAVHELFGGQDALTAGIVDHAVDPHVRARFGSSARQGHPTRMTTVHTKSAMRSWRR